MKEIDAAERDAFGSWVKDFTHAIEAKLKEKNK